MCFRPSDVAGGPAAMNCPECGKPINPMGGVMLKTCPFCKADFSKYLNEDGTPNMDAIGAAPPAPGAPQAPKAPGV